MTKNIITEEDNIFKIKLLERRESLNLDDRDNKWDSLVKCKKYYIVLLMNQQTGIVRFIGGVRSIEEDLIGIEMVNIHPRNGDGSLDGVFNFKCEKKKGYYAYSQEIQEILGSSKPKKKLKENQKY